MKSSMLRLFHNFQIVNGIVQRIFVTVMHHTSLNVEAHYVLSDETMEEFFTFLSIMKSNPEIATRYIYRAGKQGHSRRQISCRYSCTCRKSYRMIGREVELSFVSYDA